MEEMTYEELLGWFNYFERRPVGWRDDDRTHKILMVQGCKAKAEEVFPSLKALRANVNADPEKLNMASLKGSMMFHKMLSASGGEKIPL